MRNDAKVFIGAGFTSSQFIWVLPIIDGFCESRGIKNLVLESEFPAAVSALPKVQQVLDKYQIEMAQPKFFANPRIYGALWWNWLQAIWSYSGLIFRASREHLLKATNWTEVQLLHGIWDTAVSRSPDGTIRPRVLSRLLALLSVTKKKGLGAYLVKHESVEVAFLDHTVYSSKGLLASFRESGIKVFSQGGHCIYEVPEEFDTSWSTIGQSEFKVFEDLTDASDPECYWQERLKGSSAYRDSRIAAGKTREVHEGTPRNVIMLHIFRDSPFNRIDKQRIFADYIHWVAETLEIISESNEEWLVKMHPSADKWGENQGVWLEKITSLVFGRSGLPSNISISSGQYSNVELLNHVRRVVTFGGTSYLEAACFGIRPITIMKVDLGALDPASVFTPRDELSYRQLLSRKSDSDLFKLSNSQIIVAKKLLFFREKVLPLRESVGEKDMYRGETTESFKSNFENVVSVASAQYEMLRSVGNGLSRSVARSVNLEYLADWIEAHENFSDKASEQNQ